jgi:diguanylate cyclase (GGDEF)-like protein
MSDVKGGGPSASRGSGERVLVVDGHAPSLKRIADALTEAGLEVASAPSAAEVEAEGVFDLLILADAHDSDLEEALATVAERLGEPRPPLVLLLPKGSDPAAAGALSVGADSVLIRPVSGPSLTAVALGFARAGRLDRTLKRRERQLEQALRDGGQVDPRTGFYAFEHFKPLLATEVKRARRYKYPFSLIIAALDEIGAIRTQWGEEIADVLEGGLLLAISKSLRDLDLPVAYGSGQVLVVMPHTPRRGARVVAERTRRRVARTRMQGPEGPIGTTVSLGIASYEGSGEVAFANLIQEAAAALRIAIERGGDRVAEVPVTRRRRSSEG